MDLIDCIHQDDDTGAKQHLTRDPELLNRTDTVGNTPLHYAVAQRDLELIRFMTTEQRADITARNCHGETAADWFQDYIDSIGFLDNPAKLENLEPQVVEGNVELIIELLRVGISRKLRFSQGETLLHVAIQAEQAAIVKAILEGISHDRAQQLLGLKNSRGMTPLQLAQDLGKPASGKGELQKILSYLQEKQQATTPLSDPLPLLKPFEADLIAKAVADLKAALARPLTPPNFVELVPLRSALCYLAYNTCYQALHHLSTLSTQGNNGSNKLPLKELLKNLLGRWDEHTWLELEKKIRAITYSLGALIQRQQVEQVIHLSNKLTDACGWTIHHENKIYLDPAKGPNVVALVITLIHELSHWSVYSYDFVYLGTDFKEGNYSIEVDNAYQLAFKGEVGQLIPGKEELFEILQQLRVGPGGNWRRSLYQWKAMNTADIHAAAILGLATLPGGQASFKKRTLSINSYADFSRSIQDCQTLSNLPLTKTPSSSDSSEWSTMSSSGSPSPPLSLLGEQIAAHTSSEASAQPGPSRAAATEEMTREGPGLLCCLGKQ